MKLSVKSDYATRAVLGLAREYPSGEAQRVELLARQQGIPPKYLVQILIQLKARGLVKSLRGKQGGYLLAKPPAQISLGDVLRGIHGEVFDAPALADERCPAELRRAWRRLKLAADGAADAANFQQILEEGTERERMFYI